MAHIILGTFLVVVAFTVLWLAEAAPPPAVSSGAPVESDLEATDDLQTAEFKHLFWMWPWAWGDWRANGGYPDVPPPAGFGQWWG